MGSLDIDLTIDRMKVLWIAISLASLSALVASQDVVCKSGEGEIRRNVTLNTGDSFVFKTQGKKYPNNLECQADYTMGSCDQAVVNCKRFRTKANKKCTRGDIMYYYDDNSFKKFCKKKGPKWLKTSGKSFSLSFKSDGKKNARGFDCSVKCLYGGGGNSTQAPVTWPTVTSTVAPNVTWPTVTSTVAPNVTWPTVTPTVAPTVPPTTGGSGSNDCKCGLASRQTRIVGGTVTEVNEYPWQVGLVGSGGSRPFCGGSVIGDRWVLTAAHCTGSSSIQVLPGEHDTSSSNDNVVRKNVVRVIDHPSYDRSTLDYDFSPLQLDSAIDFASNEHIRPVCLPSDDSNTYAGQQATVTGWGTTSSGGSTSSTLREVVVQVLSNTECTNKGYTTSDITANMICAGVEAGGKDSCQGDSGGPLVSSGSGDGVTAGQNYEQIGVVSWGYGCAVARYPGVYARTSKVISWINSNTSGSFNTCPRT